MMKFKLKKTMLFVFLSILLCFPINRSFASSTESYAQSTFIEDASLTVRYPETVWAITQSTPRTDDYFRFEDDEFYNNTMRFLEERSHCLLAYNHENTWDLSIVVLDRVDFSLNNISPELVQYHLDEMTTEFCSSGLQIEESYFIMHPQAAVLMFRYVSQGLNTIMAITTNETQTLIINFCDAYSGSIDISDLKDLAQKIIDGLIFHFDSPIDLLGFQKVCINEIGVSFLLPSSMRWTSRNAGDIEYVATNYQHTSSTFPAYMEENDYYMMAVEPSSDFRASLLVQEAAGDIKNSVLLTDQELLYDFGNKKIDGLWTIYSSQDQWIYRNKHVAFACLLMELKGTSLYTLNAFTVVDGYHYIFIFRDTDPTRLKENSEQIMREFSVKRPTISEILTLQNNHISFVLPDDWTTTRHECSLLQGEYETENVLLQTHAIDGTRRVVYLSITDAYQGEYENHPSPSERAAFDKTYGNQLISTEIQAQGYNVISTVNCGGSEFVIFQTSNDQTCAAMASLVQGNILRIEWRLASGNALMDTWFIKLQQFAELLVNALKSY